ncbi:hypothetical protein [Clostridium uliginosum]|uniref:DUF3784 domain-containing protein n=1 Tax=Clostridium uliginosum TaxID=119641 RepID=A0A1I1S9I6_9CLOT|nr:hypothetical protein [Clostridium uliginosum]SFD43161.1 hypothetical protein SAMN05421842_1482 [Clostridium uliginosum]
MKSTTIVMFIASGWFLAIGAFIMLNKKFKMKMINNTQAKDKEKFVEFNGKFNLILGTIGIIIGALNCFLKNNDNVFLGIFVVVMLASSIIQAKLSKKYKI